MGIWTEIWTGIRWKFGQVWMGLNGNPGKNLVENLDVNLVLNLDRNLDGNLDKIWVEMSTGVDGNLGKNLV